jgi:hypothetical protein
MADETITLNLSLEFDDEFETLDSFLLHNDIGSEEEHLNIIRAGIRRPMMMLKRTMQQKWTNSINP